MNSTGKPRLGSGEPARGIDRLPPVMRSHMWKPGQSGNPTGHSGAYGEAMRLAQGAAPDAIRRLIELMCSDDERVAAVACNSILDRAFGKPRAEGEGIDSLERRIANMTRGERLQRMKELLLPMQQYLQEPHDGEEPEAQGGRHRKRGRRD